MKLVYFSWMRERLGTAEEEIAAAGVGDRRRSPRLAEDARRGFRAVFGAAGHPGGDRSVNMSATATPIAGAREIALFPPMTGG